MAISAETKMQSKDRILELELVDGKNALNSLGLVDKRLFAKDGDTNRLHLVMDPMSCLWNFRYEKGGIPEGLKGSFTGARAARKFADEYFNKRNIKITEV